MTLKEKKELVMTKLLNWKVTGEKVMMVLDNSTETISSLVTVDSLDERDANFHWVCMKEIAKREDISVLRAYHLMESFYPFVEPVVYKDELFEAIVNYTKHLCNEHIQS